TVGNDKFVAREVALFTVGFKVEPLGQKVPHHKLELCSSRIRWHSRIDLIEVGPHIVHDPGRAPDLIEFHIVSSHHQRKHSDAAQVNSAWVARPRSAGISEDRMRGEFDNLY